MRTSGRSAGCTGPTRPRFARPPRPDLPKSAQDLGVADCLRANAVDGYSLVCCSIWPRCKPGYSTAVAAAEPSTPLAALPETLDDLLENLKDDLRPLSLTIRRGIA